MKDRGYAWRPDDTLKLSLQEALQLGDGQALQNSDAGHFECTLVRNWRKYQNGATGYEIRVPILVEVDDVEITPEEPSEPPEGMSDADIIDSGALGYNLIIATEEDFVDTFAHSLEEAEETLRPYHPEPTGWEPGYQTDTIMMLSQKLGEELHIEIHNDQAQEEFYMRLVALSKEHPLGNNINFQVRKDRSRVRIDMSPQDEETAWKVGLLVAQTLHVSLDEGIDTFDPLADDHPKPKEE